MDKIPEINDAHLALFDEAPFGIQIIQENTFKYINPTIERFSGYKSEEIVGNSAENFLEIVHPEDKKLISKHLLRNEEESIGDVFSYEFRIKTKEKNYLWLSALTSVVNFEKNPAILLFLIEIDDKKRIEEKLKYYEMAIEGSDDIIVAINSDYEYMFVNNTFLKYNQLKRKEVIGHPLKEVLGKEVFDSKLKPLVDRCFKGETIRFEMKRNYPDLGERQLEVEYKPIKSGEGIKEFVLANIRDISDQQVSRKELLKAEKKYENLVENSFFGVIVINENAEILDMSEKITEIFGYSKEDWLGKDFFDFIPIKPDQIDFFKMRFQKYLEGAELKPVTIPVKRKNGETAWIDPRVTVINLGDEKLIQILVKDITEMREAERKLKESEKLYKEAFNESKFYQDLLSHDIVNIFNNIKLTVELSEMQLEEGEGISKCHDNLNLINNQVDKGINLIQNIRKLNRLKDKEIDIEEVNPSHLIQEIIDNSMLCKQEDVSVSFDIPDTMKEKTLLAGPFLAEAFENIIINGIKHNNSEEKMMVISASHEERHGINGVRFDFVDNGKGVPDDLKRKIFERGKAKDPSSSGMGLGLTIVKSIIDAFKGEIWVENRMERNHAEGSKFCVFLPLKKNEFR